MLVIVKVMTSCYCCWCHFKLIIFIVECPKFLFFTNGYHFSHIIQNLLRGISKSPPLHRVVVTNTLCAVLSSTWLALFTADRRREHFHISSALFLSCLLFFLLLTGNYELSCHLTDNHNFQGPHTVSQKKCNSNLHYY